MYSQLAMMDLNPVHLIIVLAIILLLFGGARIPELMRGLGSGMKEFKKGVAEDDGLTTQPAKKE